ncbi:MAG: thioredoxin domain-containing protein [Aromatoleum sp.]|nr:thioredoxin domain-containing protein [Aromatoleum sp.]
MMMSRYLGGVMAVVSAVALLAGAPIARAQGMTSEQAAEMLDELKQIRQLLERQPAGPGQAAPAPAPDDKVNISFASGGFSMGRADAPLTIVEYADYQCPFCQQYHNTAFAQIKANYVDTGKLRYIHRDFPLDFHENARRAAAAARCAGEQGKFWELRHVMIVNAEALQQDKLAGYASSVKLDVPKFQACITADKYKAGIDKDVAEGTAAGVSGTPSFVIGRIKKDRLEGVRMVGAAPYGQFDAKIQEMLAQPN